MIGGFLCGDAEVFPVCRRALLTLNRKIAVDVAVRIIGPHGGERHSVLRACIRKIIRNRRDSGLLQYDPQDLPAGGREALNRQPATFASGLTCAHDHQYAINFGSQNYRIGNGEYRRSV